MDIPVIFTGGTIGSTVDGNYIKPNENGSRAIIGGYCDKFPNEHRFTPYEPFNMLSENLTFSHILTLVKEIKTLLKQRPDGIIVTHGTDTLQYTAAAVSYLCYDTPCPIVFVSSNKVLSDGSANGYYNFHGAVLLIESGRKKGVYISYKNDDEAIKIHEATRAIPFVLFDDHLYSLRNSSVATVIDDDIYFHDDFAEHTGEFVFNEEISAKDIQPVLSVTAGVDFADAYQCFDFSKVAAILLVGFHSDTLPVETESFKQFCKQAEKANVNIYLCTEYKETAYVSTAAFKSLKIIPLTGISPIAAYVKLKLLSATNQTQNVILPCCNDFIEA